MQRHFKIERNQQDEDFKAYVDATAAKVRAGAYDFFLPADYTAPAEEDPREAWSLEREFSRGTVALGDWGTG